MSVYLAAPLLAWFLAHLTKFTVAALKGDVQLSWFWRMGGIPSAHTALVSSLVAVTAILDGINSPFFAMTAVLATIVIYDALGVRRTVGEHARVLKTLINPDDSTEFTTTSKRTVGHQPLEVLAGIALGVSIGLALTVGSWASNLEGFNRVLDGRELLITNAVSLGLFLLSFMVLIVINRKRWRKLPSISVLRRSVLWTLFFPSIVTFVLVLAAQQTINILSWRIWIWLFFTFVVITQAVLSYRFYRLLPDRLKQEQIHFLKQARPKRAHSKKKNKRKRN